MAPRGLTQMWVTQIGAVTLRWLNVISGTNESRAHRQRARPEGSDPVPKESESGSAAAALQRAHSTHAPAARTALHHSTATGPERASLQHGVLDGVCVCVTLTFLQTPARTARATRRPPPTHATADASCSREPLAAKIHRNPALMSLYF